jgi:hypothetical protein
MSKTKWRLSCKEDVTHRVYPWQLNCVNVCLQTFGSWEQIAIVLDGQEKWWSTLWGLGIGCPALPSEAFFPVASEFQTLKLCATTYSYVVIYPNDLWMSWPSLVKLGSAYSLLLVTLRAFFRARNDVAKMGLLASPWLSFLVSPLEIRLTALHDIWWKFEDLWRCCVIMCKIVLLVFVRRLNYNTVKMHNVSKDGFQIWDCPSQGAQQVAFMSSLPLLFTWRRKQNPAFEAL